MCSVGEKLLTVAHDYPDRRVELHFFRCEMAGEPQPLLGQEIRWVRRAELEASNFLRRTRSLSGCWLDERRGHDGHRPDGIIPVPDFEHVAGLAEVAVNVPERDWTPQAR